ncbi:hypothetical protein STEG23_014616, partial [Scotinomys teguina]
MPSSFWADLAAIHTGHHMHHAWPHLGPNAHGMIWSCRVLTAAAHAVTMSGTK